MVKIKGKEGIFMKIITICGSLKFKDEIIQSALQLELAGNVCLAPIIPNETKSLTATEIKQLGDLHKEKIKISDGIFVVDINGYIGKSTQSEIAWAKSLGKEIWYASKNELKTGA